MNLKNCLALCASLALAVMTGGCSSETNTNTTTNTNTAVVTNTTTNTTANTNTNANRAPTKEDVEKNKGTYEKQAKDAGRTVGKGASDMWLWVKARYDLAAANDLRDSTINVDVENGVITLTGTVATQDQLKKADTIAKAVEGQKGVQNKLKVSAAGNSNNANANKNANTKK
jgi:hyperosmotically inducible protein